MRLVRRSVARLLGACAVLLSCAVPASAQPSSAALARELTAALQAQKLDAFAARDPQSPDAFVAALVYPDVQLLVISGRYPAPALLEQQIKAGKYRDVYSALQMNAIKESKLFVQDRQAAGLRADEDQTADVVYEQAVTQTILSGDPGKSDYKRTLSDKDAGYSRMLKVLVDALHAQPQQPGAVAAVR
jgi:hypothetical protein